jgi:hypothetical protein
VTPPPRRWPLHPPPGAIESLSSWLARIADQYSMLPEELITHNLGIPGMPMPPDLDRDPPAALLEALAARTGTGLARLSRMTLAGWVPWLTDTLTVTAENDHDQELFDTYVRQQSVLLEPGEAGHSMVFCHPRVFGMQRRVWPGPWQPVKPLDLACPRCAMRNQGTALAWRLPLMLSCPPHRCYLADGLDVRLATGRRPFPWRVAPVEVAVMDGYTYQALASGQVALPGRTVHAAVWFRLLRCLLDELSLAISTRSSAARTTLTQVWRACGGPPGAGLTVWRPYEYLPRDKQAALLRAAAVALQMTSTRMITARGTLASVIQPETDAAVYDGDPPRPHPPRGSQEREPSPVYDGARPEPHPVRAAMAALEESLRLARSDPDQARQALRMFTSFTTSRDLAGQIRDSMISCGVPAEWLPSAGEDRPGSAAPQRAARPPA